VSLDDFVEKANEAAPLGADEVIGWTDRVGGLFASTESLILGSDLGVVKKTVLNNKLVLMKKTTGTKLGLTKKYHWVIPCLSL
jgi:hypothetical protein